MANHIFPNFRPHLLSAALALPLAIGLGTAGPAQAQNFDTTTLNAEAFAVQDSGTVPGASAAGLNSNGASGDVGRTSYKTGEAPGFSGLSGNTSSVTGRQLGGLTNHLSFALRRHRRFGSRLRPGLRPDHSATLHDHFGRPDQYW